VVASDESTVAENLEQDHAAQIVRAVNAFEPMREVLEDIRIDTPNMRPSTWSKLRAALALAQAAPAKEEGK
jgi:hypothetical protein